MKGKIERALERTTDTKECLLGAGVVSRFTGIDAIFRLGLLPQLKEYLFDFCCG